jgi:LCP family protein required for cell wall assembly
MSRYHRPLVPIVGILLAAGLAACVGDAAGDPDEPAASEPAASEPAATEPPLNEELLGSRLTVLVIGLDRDEERASLDQPVNSDSLMLASVSADQSEVAVVSLPRDTVDLPASDGGTRPGKVNEIYAADGADALVTTFEALFEVDIDHYVAIDMDDFVTLVDAAGGVDVQVEERLEDPGFGFVVESGDQHLEGRDVLHYVQTRVDTDHGRSARQQQVLLELVRRLVDPEADVTLEELVEGLDSLETDLPLEDLPTLVEIARRAQDADVTREVLKPPRFAEFEGETPDRGWVLIPNVAEMRSFVGDLMGDD